MATLSQTIRLIFEGVDRTGQAVDSVVKNLDGVTSSVNAATAPLANFTTDILKFEAATIGAGVALATYAAAVSQDFERSFREIATLIEVPLDELDSFRSSILEYAQTSTSSLDEITAATYDAISAGVAWEDSLEAVEAAQRLGIAGNATLNEGLNALIPTLNAYGLGVDEAARFSDVLFSTVKNGRTTIPELSASLGKVAPLAAAAGISFEEIGAAISTLTAAGSSTSEAVTKTTQAIVALTKPTSAAAKISDELGIQFNLAAVRANGFGNTLQTVVQATKGNDEQLARLFGSVEGLTGALVIGGAGAEKFANDLRDAETAAGDVAGAVTKFQGVLDTGASAGQVALVKLGDAFQDAFFRSKAAITDIINAIANTLGGANFASLLAQIQGFGTAIAQTLEEVARNLPQALSQADLSGFENGIRQVADALNRFFGDIDITTVEGLQAAIEKAGTAVDKLGTFTAATIDELKPLFGLFSGFLDSAIEADSGLVALAGSVGGLAIATQTLLPIVDTLLLTFLAIGGTGGAVAKATAAVAALGGILKTVGAGAAAFATSTAGLVAGAAALGAGVGTLVTKYTDADEALGDWLGSLLDLERRQNDAVGQLVFTADSFDGVAVAIAKTRREHEEWEKSLGDGLTEAQRNNELIIAESDALNRLTDSFAEQGLIYNQLTGEVKEFSGAIYEVATAADIAAAELETGKRVVAQYTDETGKLVKVYQDISGGAETAKQSLGELLTGTLDNAAAFNQFAEDTGVAKDKILEFATELEKTKIEVQGRFDIAEIEANAEIARAQIEALETVAIARIELDIAEVQANAQVATALIASVGEAAAGTNENIRTVIDAIAGLDEADKLAFRKETILRKQLETENDRAERQLVLQEKLTDAQIAYYQESTRRLRTGDALIKINGDGLEPELEAFMFAVLRRVQLVAQQDQAGFLLGLPA